MLHTLSHAELTERIAILVTKKRTITAKLLAHLGEFDARRLYAEAGHPSMFAYLVEAHRYSEPAAARRVKASRVIHKRPELAALVESGELHLTALHLMAAHMTDANADDLVTRCRGKGKRAIEEILASTCGAKPASDREVTKLTPRLDTGSEPLFASSDKTPPAELVFDVRVSVTLDQETFAALKRIQALGGATSMAEAIKKAADVYLDRKDPERKLGQKASPPETDTAHGDAAPKSASRYIPVASKRAAYQACGGQCAYVSPDGRRCSARTQLEFDHVTPYSAGGGSDAKNVRLLCRVHNLGEACKYFGAEFMASKIRRRRDATATGRWAGEPKSAMRRYGLLEAVL